MLIDSYLLSLERIGTSYSDQPLQWVVHLVPTTMATAKNQVFLVGDNTECMQQFQEVVKKYLPSTSRPEIIRRSTLLDDFNRKTVRANKFVFVSAHHPRVIIYDKSHPARSFDKEIDWADTDSSEDSDQVLIIIYVDQETKKDHLYTESVEHLFTSGGGQRRLQIYANRNRIITLRKDTGELNTAQQAELKNFWFLADSPVIEKNHREKAKDKFWTDMAGLLDSDEADLLVKVGDKLVHVHKALLNAFSEGFKKETAQLDPKADVLVIKDTTYKAVQATFQWIYTITLPDDCQDELFDIWKLADRYDVTLLKTECEERISDDISVDNVLALVRKAETAKCSRVRDECFKFIVAHPRLLRDKEEMTDISPALLLDIFRKVKLVDESEEQ